MSAVIVLDEPTKVQVRKTLDALAVEKRPCAACKRALWFVTTKTGKTMPIDDDMVAHFASCTDPARFRKGGRS